MKFSLLQIAAFLIFSLASAVALLWVSLTSANNKLDAAEKVIHGYERVVEATDRINASEGTRREQVEVIVRQIQDAPNANVLIPTDVAIAWGNGIDSMCNDCSAPNNANANVPGPDANKAGDGRAHSRATSTVLEPATRSVSKLRQTSAGSGKAVRG